MTDKQDCCPKCGEDLGYNRDHTADSYECVCNQLEQANLRLTALQDAARKVLEHIDSDDGFYFNDYRIAVTLREAIGE